MLVGNTHLGMMKGATGWNISNASFSASFSVAGQDIDPQSLAFSSDGTKMYWGGVTNDTIYQYTLSTPWSASSASYASKSFSLATQLPAHRCIFFKPDGTTMYAVEGSVFQYTLSTAWYISTASYANKSFSFAAQDGSGRSCFFSPDGTKMYVAGAVNDTIYQYTLSTPWDVSTASYASKSFSITSQDTNVHDLFFSADGTKMFMLGGTNSTVYQYTLSTPWDVSTSSYDNISILLTGQGLLPYAMSFSADGTKMYTGSASTDVINQWNLG